MSEWLHLIHWRGCHYLSMPNNQSLVYPRLYWKPPIVFLSRLPRTGAKQANYVIEWSTGKHVNGAPNLHLYILHPSHDWEHTMRYFVLVSGTVFPYYLHIFYRRHIITKLYQRPGPGWLREANLIHQMPDQNGRYIPTAVTNAFSQKV